MKKVFLLIKISIIILILGFGFVLAQDRPLEVNYPEIQGFKPTTISTDPAQFIKYIFNFVIIISGIIAFGVLVWVGIRYLTSVGKPEEMKEAKKRLRSVILGLLILLFSYLIIFTINKNILVINFPTLTPAPYTEIATSTQPEEPTPDIFEKIKTLVHDIAQTSGTIVKSLKLKKDFMYRYCDCKNTLPMCICASPSNTGSSQVLNSFLNPSFLTSQFNSVQFLTSISQDLLSNANYQLLSGTNIFVNKSAFSVGELNNLNFFANYTKNFFGGNFQDVLNNAQIYIVGNQDYKNIISQVSKYLDDFVKNGVINQIQKEQFLSNLPNSISLIFNQQLPATIIVNGNNLLKAEDLHKEYLRLYAYAIDQVYNFSKSPEYLKIYNQAVKIGAFVNDYARLLNESWIDFAESIVYYYTYGIPEWISNDPKIQISLKERFDYFRDNGIVEKLNPELEYLYRYSGTNIKFYDYPLSSFQNSSFLQNQSTQLLPNTQVKLIGDFSDQDTEKWQFIVDSTLENFNPKYQELLKNTPVYIADKKNYNEIVEHYLNILYIQGKYTKEQINKLLKEYYIDSYGMYGGPDGSVLINSPATLNSQEFEGGPRWIIGHKWSHRIYRSSDFSDYSYIYEKALAYSNSSEENKDKGFATFYAKTNAEEDFCETVSAYFYSYGNPAFLSDDPYTQELIKERFDYLREKGVVGPPPDWPY